MQAQVDSSGTTNFYTIDGHGSTRGLVNSSGQVTATFNYDAFGNLLASSSTPTDVTIFLFGGDAVFDPHSGLYMNGDGTRDRLPGVGGFIQADGQGNGSNQDPIGLSLYLYGSADPISMTDPSGFDGADDYGDLFDDSGWEGYLGYAASVADAVQNQDYETYGLAMAIGDDPSDSLIGIETSAALPIDPTSSSGSSGSSSGWTSAGSSGSSARKVKPVRAAGPVMTPNAMYFLLDPNGAIGGLGHAATIIPNGHGCAYFSYGDDPGNPTLVTGVTFNNIGDALSKSSQTRWLYARIALGRQPRRSESCDSGSN